MGSERQRVEPRVKSRGRFGILVEGEKPILADVCDVSISGICLEAEASVAVGTSVQLDGNGIVADGIVRYCHAQGGKYRIGVALQPPA